MTANLHGTVLNTTQYTLDESSDYSVFATSFANVDAAHLSLALTVDPQATTGRALVSFHGNATVPTGETGAFNLLVNGTLNAANDGLMFLSEGTFPVSFTRLVTDLVVGTLNTVTLQAKVTGGTMTVYSGAGTGNQDTHGQFWGLVL